MKLRNIILLFATSLILSACQSNSSKTKDTAEDTKEVTTVEDNSIKLIELKLKDVNGKELSLMNEVKKHKITVIDFWASWCRPCISEMPEMVDIYGQFKNKGLGIIGISLDDNEESWKSAIKEHGLTWTHVSDLKGWQSDAAVTYNVTGIPFTIIADSDGKILATGLRSHEIRDFLTKNL